MYTIVKLLNGKYLGVFKLQDGTERYTYDTLDEAIKGAKQFAETMNGARGEHRLNKKHINYLQEQPVTEVRYIPWKP